MTIRLAPCSGLGSERPVWAWQFSDAPTCLEEGLVLDIRLGQDDGGTGWRQCGTAKAVIRRQLATGEYDHSYCPECICQSCRDYWVAELLGS